MLDGGEKDDSESAVSAAIAARGDVCQRTGDVGDATLGERLVLSSGFIAVTVVVHRATGKPAAPAHRQSRGFSEDPKALEAVARKVEDELEVLAADNVTEVTRIAQGVRRVVGR